MEMFFGDNFYDIAGGNDSMVSGFQDGTAPEGNYSYFYKSASSYTETTEDDENADKLTFPVSIDDENGEVVLTIKLGKIEYPVKDLSSNDSEMLFKRIGVYFDLNEEQYNLVVAAIDKDYNKYYINVKQDSDDLKESSEASDSDKSKQNTNTEA